MAEGTVEEPPVNRRRIIERPRLTRLLDESPARVKMLVAPAGYGKTTLARQWLAMRPSPVAWIQCVPASSDVAALVSAIATAAATTTERSTERTVERVRAAREPTRELPLLMDLLVADLQTCVPSTLLAFDDYHELLASPDAEQVVYEIITRTGIDVLVTSRRRPTWATSRALVYGEIIELTQSDLAMTASEAREVLGAFTDKHDDDLAAAADGWPAFIALAASTTELTVSERAPQSNLYDYLASEVFTTASRETQSALVEVSLAPRSHGWLLTQLYARETAARIRDDAVRLGILSESTPDDPDLHPLLQRFLRQQCLGLGNEAIDAAVERLWRVLLKHGRWDDLFLLLVRAHRPQRLPALIDLALRKLLDEGRSATLAKWVSYAVENDIDDPVVRVADAEVALREGRFARAEVIAIEAAQMKSASEDDAAQAWCIAGRAAHLSSNDETAFTYFQHATQLATSDATRRVAQWGSFVVATDLEAAETESALREIVASASEDAAGVVARWNAQLLYELRLGGIRSLREARVAHEVLDRVADPVRRTAFQSAYCLGLALAAFYEDALDCSDAFLADAEGARVDFAVPYAQTVRGVSLVGLKRYDEGLKVLREAEAAAVRLSDLYASANARAAISRALLSRGEYEEALDSLDFETGAGVTAGLAGEILACRSVALACLGHTGAVDAARQARDLTRTLETRVLTAMTEAISASLGNARAAEHAIVAFDAAADSGAWDMLVCAYRAHPEILLPLRGEPAKMAVLRNVMARAADDALCATLGLNVHVRGSALLSPREREIHSLLALGLSNKEIAARLVISEATVKLHVHHVYEKLGVRTRVAAAARYRDRDNDSRRE